MSNRNIDWGIVSVIVFLGMLLIGIIILFCLGSTKYVSHEEPIFIYRKDLDYQWVSEDTYQYLVEDIRCTSKPICFGERMKDDGYIISTNYKKEFIYENKWHTIELNCSDDNYLIYNEISKNKIYRKYEYIVYSEQFCEGE